jgi:photosystem II stability/assembly factor-like uncharacterized protein
MKPEPNWSRRALLALALQVGCAQAAASVVEPLARPSQPVQRGEGAVLLAGSVAGQRVVAVGERGLILASDDGGSSWRQMRSPVSVTLTAVRFSDATHGVAVGHGGVVLVSADAGATWSIMLDGRRAAQHVLANAKAGGEMAAIRDAERLVEDGPDKPLLDLLLGGNDDIVVAGAYGLALSSVDGGHSWRSWGERLDNPGGLHVYALRRRADTLVVAGEQGLVRISEDGGRSFRRVQTPYRGSFFTAEFLREQGIVLAGLRGNVWQGDDDGRHWRELRSPVSASVTCSLVLPDGQLLLGNQAGFVMRLAGDRLEPVHDKALPPINGLVAIAGGQRVIALTVMGIAALPVAGAKG